MEEEVESEHPERLCQAVSPNDEPCDFLRQYIARSAGDGSAMLTPRTKSGIRACCQLRKRAAKGKSTTIGRQKYK